MGTESMPAAAALFTCTAAPPVTNFVQVSSFFFSSRRRHTSWPRDWSSDVCSSDLEGVARHEDDDCDQQELRPPTPPRGENEAEDDQGREDRSELIAGQAACDEG